MVNVITFIKVTAFPFLSANMQKRIRDRKLRKIISYAKNNSKFYAKLYKDIDIDNLDSLSKLPCIDKKTVMDNFDDIVTDKNVTLNKANEFISDLKNLDNSFLGKYKVMTTSGSTWKPVVFVADKHHIDAFFSASVHRMRTKYFPYCTITTDNGFYFGNVMLRGQKNNYFNYVDSLKPTADIVKDLNDVNPKQMQTYPSTLGILAYEQSQGNLKLNLKRICSTAENLPSDMRKSFEDVFGCKVYSIYSSTETGHIASDCDFGHMHFYEDNVIIEAVDKDGNPVKDGEISDKILITNLNNKVMPLIRYEVTDRVIIHRDKCKCGSTLPWIEVFGRTAPPSLNFERDGKKIMVTFDNISMGVDYLNVTSVQAVRHGQYKVEIRLLMRNQEKFAENKKVYKQKYEQIFAEQGLSDVEIEISDTPPKRDEKSGKLPYVIELD